MSKKDIKYIFIILGMVFLAFSCHSARHTTATATDKTSSPKLSVYEEAVQRSQQGDYEQALALFDQLEKQQGVNEELTFQKQRIYLKLNKPDSAAFEIKKLISRYPENFRYYALLAKLYSDQDRLEEAIEIYQSFLKKHPAHSKALIALAILYKRNHNDSAFQKYIAKAFADPDLDIEHKITFVSPFLQYVEIDPSQKKEALQLCRFIVKAHPQDVRSYSLLGNMFSQCKLPDSAAQAYQAALDLDPKDKELKNRIYTSLAEAYNDLEKYNASDSCFELALQIDPRDDLTLNNYSYHLSERGTNLEKALQMSEQALEIKPRENTYQDTYAWVLFKMGKYKTAKKWMEKALSHPGASDQPLYLEHYGHILYKLNDIRSAQKYWNLAKEKREKNKWYENK